MRKAHNSKLKTQNSTLRTAQQFKTQNSKSASPTIQNSKLKIQNSKYA
mgnify:CR=1 FL=1